MEGIYNVDQQRDDEGGHLIDKINRSKSDNAGVHILLSVPPCNYSLSPEAEDSASYSWNTRRNVIPGEIPLNTKP